MSYIISEVENLRGWLTTVVARLRPGNGDRAGVAVFFDGDQAGVGWNGAAGLILHFNG